MQSAPKKDCECFDCFNHADRDSGKNEKVSFQDGHKIVEADGEMRPYLHGVDSKPSGPSRSNTGMSTKSVGSSGSDRDHSHSKYVSTSYDSAGNKIQELKGNAPVGVHYNWDTNSNTDYSEPNPGRVSRTNTSGSSHNRNY